MQDDRRKQGFGNIRRIHPARVVLSGHDKRFLRVASFLLARRGFHVSAAPTNGELMGLLERTPVDVVVIDGSNSLSTAATTAAALCALHPAVRVLIATENGNPGWRGGHRVIEKWRGFEDLADEVERAHVALDNDTTSLEPG